VTNRVLRTALMALLGLPAERRDQTKVEHLDLAVTKAREIQQQAAELAARGTTDPAPTLPVSVTGDKHPDLASEMQRRAGRTLDSLHVEGVPPGHQHYPPSKKFNCIGDTVYVRDEDYPALRAALIRRRREAINNENKEQRDDAES
jgi:hypothetical protein